MRKWRLFIILLFSAATVRAQNLDSEKEAVQQKVDSFHRLLLAEKTDTGKAKLLSLLAYNYPAVNKDSSWWYHQLALRKYQELKDIKGEADVSMSIANIYSITGNYPQAVSMALRCLKLAKQTNDTLLLFWATRAVRNAYAFMNDYATAIDYARKIRSIVHSGYFKDEYKIKDFDFSLSGYLILMANGFEKLNQLDSALSYALLSYNTALAINDTTYLAITTGNLGNTYLKLGNYDSAFAYYKNSVLYAIPLKRNDILGETYLGMGTLNMKKGRMDSALYYGKLSLQLYQQWQRPEGELEANSFLTKAYTRLKQTDSAFKYQTLTLHLKDSLFNLEKLKQVSNIGFDETLRQQQIEQEKREVEQRYQNKIKIFSLLAALLVLLIIAIILYRNNKQKQKANALLHQQQVSTERALEELKATQTQLIQKEKMASLGELTAGIAHEIQNPLNFVNNFSEVSVELLAEAKEHIINNKKEEVMEAVEDAQQSLEKVIHHGKRADAIVKSMLEHSRSSKGEKQPTDINVLADEYLRLSYHGLRAKDKSFNATLETHFDESIGKTEVIPPDIGRVLLNLFNNAFYAVTEKKKISGEGYEPSVSVSTKKLADSVEIRVKDNGPGIPQKAVDKIFQPFFTTKPAGRGTGLGLSLSYDIIKAHRGELKVETKEGEGAEFIIQLPMT